MTFGAGCFGGILESVAKDWRASHRFREDSIMSALTNRREARDRALAAFRAALDRTIPPGRVDSLEGLEVR